jgi:hypothetical protein
MFVYFYHRENLPNYDRKYPLTTVELKILKKFLVKKLIQDKRKFKVLNIDGLTQETYVKFLLDNPPIYRRNIIKCKLFKKIVKMMRGTIVDFNTRYLSQCDDTNIQIFSNFVPKQAYNEMTNTFFLTCLANTTFRADFYHLLQNDMLISRIVKESKKKFVLKVEKWITIFAQNLNGMSALEESRMMLKVRLNSSRDEILEARQCFLVMVEGLDS